MNRSALVRVVLIAATLCGACQEATTAPSASASEVSTSSTSTTATGILHVGSPFAIAIPPNNCGSVTATTMATITEVDGGGHFTLQSPLGMTYGQPQQLTFDISDSGGSLSGTVSGSYVFTENALIMLTFGASPLIGTLHADGSMSGTFDAAFKPIIDSDGWQGCNVKSAAWSATPLSH